MDISGTKNLSLLRRMALGHITYCSVKATRASDKDINEVWDPEIKEAQELLTAVEINLKRAEDEGLMSEGNKEVKSEDFFR